MSQYSFERLRPEYQQLWQRMSVVKTKEAMAQAKRVCSITAKQRYKTIEQQTGVPWFVVGCLHMRESNGNFSTYLGNGQPLSMVTTIAPRGRGPFQSFEAGAYDALIRVERLDEITDWGPEHVAYACEKYNGFGYRHPARNIPSPYLWGGTNIQKRGKFVRDGVYDPRVMDPQIGAMAVLKCIMEIDAEARFPETKPVPMPPQAPYPTERPSPKAEDTEDGIKQLPKSKTIFGGISQWFIAQVMAFVAFLQGLPPWLIALIVVASLLALYLVIKGRIDVNEVVKHLSKED